MDNELVKTYKCVNCGADINITKFDIEFFEKISPVINGEKFEIPFPSICHNCRYQRRLAWRNERFLYKRKCDISGKSIDHFCEGMTVLNKYDKDNYFNEEPEYFRFIGE